MKTAAPASLNGTINKHGPIEVHPANEHLWFGFSMSSMGIAYEIIRDIRISPFLRKHGVDFDETHIRDWQKGRVTLAG